MSEKAQEKPQDLTQGERELMQALYLEIIKAKAALFDAQNSLKTAQDNFAIKLRSISDQHGITGDVEMTPDFQRISPKGVLNGLAR